MLNWFRRGHAAPAAVPEGERVYVIGDIHGRADLLDMLLDQVCRDDAIRSPAKTTTILIGDLVDRGADSAGVIARAMAGLDWSELVTIKGNHEQAMAAALAGDRRMMAHWLEFGGLETLRSFGVEDAVLRDGSLAELAAAGNARIDPGVRRWLARLPTHLTIGDYHFVHAGVRPGVPLAAQRDEDRIWIRGEFLDSRAAHGATIVHGHTQVPDVAFRANRIGIDTGAYRTDRLTALALEGVERRVIQT